MNTFLLWRNLINIYLLIEEGAQIHKVHVTDLRVEFVLRMRHLKYRSEISIPQLHTQIRYQHAMLTLICTFHTQSFIPDSLTRDCFRSMHAAMSSCISHRCHVFTHFSYCKEAVFMALSLDLPLRSPMLQ